MGTTASSIDRMKDFMSKDIKHKAYKFYQIFSDDCHNESLLINQNEYNLIKSICELSNVCQCEKCNKANIAFHEWINLIAIDAVVHKNKEILDIAYDYGGRCVGFDNDSDWLLPSDIKQYIEFAQNYIADRHKAMLNSEIVDFANR